MSNNLGTLSSSLVSLRVIEYLKEMFPPVLRMFINFSDERAQLNQSLTGRIPGASAAYDASAGYAAQDVTDTDVPVTASHFKATSIKFTPAEMSSTSRDLVDEHAAAAAAELGAELMDDFFGIILAAAFANKTVELASAFDDDTVRGVRKKLVNRKVRMMGALGVINADAYESLTGDQVVSSTDSNPQAHELFELAPQRVKQRGFEIFEYPQLPDNGEDLVGAFLTPGAIVGATGIPRDANEAGFWDDAPANALVRPQTDPDTGITLLERRTRGADGSAQMDLAWIYGFAKGDPARLERVAEA